MVAPLALTALATVTIGIANLRVANLDDGILRVKLAVGAGEVPARA